MPLKLVAEYCPEKVARVPMLSAWVCRAVVLGWVS